MATSSWGIVQNYRIILPNSKCKTLIHNSIRYVDLKNIKCVFYILYLFIPFQFFYSKLERPPGGGETVSANQMSWFMMD